MHMFSMPVCTCSLSQDVGSNHMHTFEAGDCENWRNPKKYTRGRDNSEQKSESLLLFLFHGMEFWVIFFSSGEWFRTKFRELASIFVPLYGIPSIFSFVYFVFRGIFLSEIPNPKCKYSKKIGVSKTHLLIEGLVGETVTCSITIKRRDRF